MAIKNPTIIDTGNQKERLCPEIMTTIARGRKPIKKLTSAAKAALTAKI
jgi:hypothetical protein